MGGGEVQAALHDVDYFLLYCCCSRNCVARKLLRSTWRVQPKSRGFRVSNPTPRKFMLFFIFNSATTLYCFSRAANPPTRTLSETKPVAIQTCGVAASKVRFFRF